MKSRLILCLSGILSLICLFCFGTKAQNTSLPVGTVPGSADVTAMGAATYNIPIEVVPGTHGMQPNLNVVYNSMANTGILGSQWDLGGDFRHHPGGTEHISGPTFLFRIFGLYR